MSDNYEDGAVGSEWSEAKRPVREFLNSMLRAFNDARRYLARLIDPPMYTYFVSLPTPQEKYKSGACGVAQVAVNTPYQIIDIVTCCKPATFNLTSFYVGDENQLLGAGAVPADMFAPAVQNRFVRFKWAQRGQVIAVGFLNISQNETPEQLVFALKVRSYRRQ